MLLQIRHSFPNKRLNIVKWAVLYEFKRTINIYDKIKDHKTKGIQYQNYIPLEIREGMSKDIKPR